MRRKKSALEKFKVYYEETPTSKSFRDSVQARFEWIRRKK